MDWIKDFIYGKEKSFSECPMMSARRKEPMVLQNYEDDNEVLFDTLHCKADQFANPENSVCKGALMQPENLHEINSQHKAARKSDAIDFFNQFFSSKVNSNKLEYQERLDYVLEKIEHDGYYSLTMEELSFGTTTAWRNAPRCIGKVQWRNLQLFDGRNVTSADEMFEMLCKHIEYGTNEGNIRSGITLFPSSQSGVKCRIWNRQFISYAGFKNKDGTIDGDPGNVQFTNLCLKLGWKPVVTRFTVLPLVLQYGDEDPKVYDIPSSLVLEVPITHPRYPGLESLKLKWYALPAVCDMSFHCGGNIYQACGFNGWYMSTEIVRDFLDVQRYNLIKEVAESMGFDSNEPAFHWKDTVAAELNVAVITSFEKVGATITDHHTASDNFVQHMKTEQFLRGGCPADWVWITPPQGGALTSVFHQEMINYRLKPSFEYQPRPWVSFPWKKNIFKTEAREMKITFRQVSRAVIVCFKIHKYIKAQRKSCTILFATETGQSQKFAHKLQNKLLVKGFNAETFSMNTYDSSRLINEPMVLVVTSTFGNGEAPGNGKEFSMYLDELENSTDLPSNMGRFGVFGLGSSAYPDFCAFAQKVNKQLGNIGFHSLLPIHTGDQKKNQEMAFQVWTKKLIPKICQYYGVKEQKQTSKLICDVENMTEACQYRLIQSYRSPPRVSKGLHMLHDKDVTEFETISVKSVIKPDGNYDTYLVKLHLDGIDYEPGDHLVVFPTNNHSSVLNFCNHLIFEEGISASSNVRLERASRSKTADEYHSHMPITSLSNALTYYLDIESLPTQDDIESLLQNCKCSLEERKHLFHLATDLQTYSEWADTKPTWTDLITQYPSIRIPAAYVLAELPHLKPRYYSISSSVKSHSSEVHLTVTLNYFTTHRNNNKITKYGLCSSWLRNLSKGSKVRAYVSRSPGFHLVQDADVIMIGTGSGMAPFRGFWEEKKFVKETKRNTSKIGNLHLFQGARTKSTLLFANEIKEAQLQHTIDSVHDAYSREENIKKTYVQDKLRKNQKLIYNLLVHRNAHIYICGNDKMASGVSQAVRSILENGANEQTTLTMNKQKKIICSLSLDELRSTGRYHEDIFS